MDQENKKLGKKTEQDPVSSRMMDALDKLSKDGIIKNPRQGSELIGLNYSNSTKYRRGEKNISSGIIYDAVNNLGINANYLFLKDGPEKEKVLLEGSNQINGNIGDSNTFITGGDNSNRSTIHANNNVGTINVVHSLDKLINELPPELQKKLQEHIDYMSGEITLLKKMLDEHKTELSEKKAEIVEYKSELIETRKDAKESREKLISTMNNLGEAQQEISKMQKLYLEAISKKN